MLAQFEGFLLSLRQKSFPSNHPTSEMICVSLRFFCLWLLTFVQLYKMETASVVICPVWERIPLWVFYTWGLKSVLPLWLLHFTSMMSGRFMVSHHSQEQKDQGSAWALLMARVSNITLETCPVLPPPILIGWNICLLRHFWHVIYCWQQERGSLMINLLWDWACFMGFMSVRLNYAWVFL